MSYSKAIPNARVVATAIATIMMLTGAAAGAETATGTFQVLLQIEGTCSVTAGAGSNIDFGPVSTSQTDVPGQSSISVTCTKGTPYYIGLAPSNNRTDGSGEMSSTTTGNGDLVPYQLQRTAGADGTIWGNTATTTTAGNGVAATGSGATQPHTVYAIAPSADFTVDSYSDTVTVTVNY